MMTLAAAVFLSLDPALPAARQQETFPGFGGLVLAVGDVDGDKLGDLLVLDSVGVGFGSGGWLPGARTERAWIVSPAAGRVFFDFGARDFSWQRLKCAAVGDVDRDGFERSRSARRARAATASASASSVANSLPSRRPPD